MKYPTAGQGVLTTAVLLFLAWYLAGLIVESAVFLRVVVAVAILSLELIAVWFVQMAKDFLVEYAGELENRREE